MIVEYVLLLVILLAFIVSLFSGGNGTFSKTFTTSAPRLGARVEKLVRTGEGFEGSQSAPWLR